MRCKNCGANIPEGSMFCTKCGAPVMQQTVQQTPDGRPQAGKAGMSKGTKAVFIIGIVLFVLVAAVAVLYLAFPDVLDGLTKEAAHSYTDKSDYSDDDDDKDDKDDEKEEESTSEETAAVTEEVATTDSVGGGFIEDKNEEEEETETEASAEYELNASVGIVFPSETDENLLLTEAIASEIEVHGGEAIVMSYDYNVESAVTNIQNLIASGVDAIIFRSSDLDLRGLAATIAEEAGIAFVLFGENTDGTVHAVARNLDSLGELLGTTGYGNVFIINGVSESYDCDTLEAAVIDSLDSSAVLLGIEYTDYNTDSAVAILENVLQAYPDVETIICLDPYSAAYLDDVLTEYDFLGFYYCYIDEYRLDEQDFYLSFSFYFPSADIAEACAYKVWEALLGYEPYIKYVFPEMYDSY